MKNTDLSYWQRTARWYAPFMKQNERVYQAIGREVEPYLNRRMNVLELACGSGQMSLRLACKTRLWEATDSSSRMIALAKERSNSRRLHFSVQDAAELPYADESFDAVMIAHALHVIPEPERVLSEIYRVLKADGVLFAPTFVYLPGKKPGIRMKLLEATGLRTYQKWNAGEWITFLSEHGFVVQRHHLIEGGLMPSCCMIAAKNPLWRQLLEKENVIGVFGVAMKK